MESRVFRQKSMDRVSSPEQLNDYIRAASPGLWVFLTAVVLILIGVFAWGVFGRLDTTLSCPAVCENGTLTCYIREADAEKVTAGISLTVDGTAYTLEAVAAEPVEAAGALSAYALHLGGLSEADWVYPATAQAALADGIYTATLTLDSVSPISFLFN